MARNRIKFPASENHEDCVIPCMASPVHSVLGYWPIAATGIHFPLTSDLQSADGTYTLTHTRVATRYYIDDSGVLQSQSGNTPVFLNGGISTTDRAFNYIPSASYRDYSHANWTKTNCTVDSDSVTCPDNDTRTTNTITATGANATIIHVAYTSAASTWTGGFFLKRKTGTGTIEITTNNGTTWTAVTVTNDWTFVPVTFTSSANPQIGLRIVTSGDAVYSDWTQLTAGSEFANSFSPGGGPGTAGGEHLRLADEVLTDFNDGALSAKLTIPSWALYSGSRFCGAQGLTYITPYVNPNGQIVAFWGGSARTSTVGLFTFDTEQRVAVGYDGTNVYGACEGTSWEGTSANVGGTFTRWNPAGTNAGDQGFWGEIKDIIFYPDGKTKEELKTITTS